MGNNPWENLSTSRRSSLTDCLGWRRWRWFGSVLRRLFTYRHTLKPLVPVLRLGAALVVVIMYGQVDRLRNFVAGIFIPQYHYTYAVPLCFTQVLVSLLFLQVLHLVGLTPLQPYSLTRGELLLVPSICDSAQAVMALRSMASSTQSGLYPLAQRLLPLVSLGWIHGLGLGEETSIHLSIHVCILLTVGTVTSVAITASHGLYIVDTVECVYSLMGLILHSLSLVCLSWASRYEGRQRQTSDVQVTAFDLYFTHLVNQSLVLGFLCLLHPDGPQALHGGSWHSLLFLGYLLAILLLGMVQHFLVMVTALWWSPVAAAVLHTARELAQPFHLRFL